MAPPLPPVTSNVPKRELPVQEIRVVDAMLQRDFEAQQAVDHAKQMYPDGQYLVDRLSVIILTLFYSK